MRTLTCLFCLLLSIPSSVPADETVRQLQEELRKRNLYFGNIDGQTSPVLVDALKRYQTRKGFPITGKLDQDTATSLHIQAATVAVTASLPDLPVLKSDRARALTESQRLALQREAEDKPDLTPERVNKFVQDYLRDGETDDVAAQVKYYAFPVRYFDHGTVSEQFVTKDTSNYLKRWPERKYTLTGPVNFFASGNEGETELEFTIAFELRSPGRTTKNRAVGHTRNWWSIQAKGDELKIVAIREARLRE